MSALLRNIVVLLCALALVLVPVVGSANGKGGLVNLPGGAPLASHTSGGNGSPSVVRSAGQDLTLVLDPNMLGSVVAISLAGSPESAYSATENGRYVLSSADMGTLVQAGVREVGFTFLSPNGLWLKVLVTFAENQRVVVSFP